MLQDVTYLTKLIAATIINIANMDLASARANLMSPITNSMFDKKINIFLNDLMANFEWYHVVKKISNNITGRIYDAKNQLMQIAGAAIGYMAIINPTIIIASWAKQFTAALLDPLGYRQEKIADNFVTIYGYGTELSSGVLKLETNNSRNYIFDKYYGDTFIGKFIKTGHGFLTMYGTILDAHPHAVERNLDQVRYLKAELAREKMNPELKKVISKQIDEIESNLESVINDPKLDEHWDAFRYIYAKSVYYTDGDDRHKFMGKNIHANIQKNYNRAIKSLK